LTVVANPRLLTLNKRALFVRTETMSFSVTPQISGRLGPDAEPDAHRAVRPRWIESDHACARGRRRDAVVSGFTRDREIKEKKAGRASAVGGSRSTVVTPPARGDGDSARSAMPNADRFGANVFRSCAMGPYRPGRPVLSAVSWMGCSITRDAARIGRATLGDFADHMTTVFTDVRLKRFLEMRGADADRRR